jgi:hypothetical protein
MKKNKKNFSAVVVGVLVSVLLVGGSVFANYESGRIYQNIENYYEAGEAEQLGGVYNNYGVRDFADGISVDGTTVIDGSGALTIPSGQNFTVVSGNIGLTSGNLTLTSGNFTMSDGVLSITDNIASPTAESVYTLSATCSGLGQTGGGCIDGFTSYLKFLQEMEGNSSVGTPTTTGYIAMVFDDTASTSMETSMQFAQILDDGKLPTTVFELDSGDPWFYGKLAVGRTFTASSAVEIYPTAAATDLFRISSSSSGSVLAVTSSGYVGINDLTPSYYLDINGTLRAVGAGTFDSTLTVSGESQLNQTVLGGNIYSSSTVAGNWTLSAADFCDYVGYEVITNGTAPTFTLPASSTIAADCLNTNADTVIRYFYNNSTAATSTTIAAGSGIDLDNATTTYAIPKDHTGKLECARVSATANIGTRCLFDIYSD